jgi:energy-coupling factor transporter ATP-binding protein EcfA2
MKVLIAHAKGEESLAEKLAGPIRDAGYDVVHQGTVLIGESVVEEASKVLSSGAPLVLCGTITGLGTGWAHRLVHAARQYEGVRVFALQMEKEAYVQQLSLDGTFALYWEDPTKAINDLISALGKHYPLSSRSDWLSSSFEVEQKYRQLALDSCDIIDLANMPETDRHIATRQLELRRLYVPLRVQTEIKSNTAVTGLAIEAIEKRRNTTLYGFGQWGKRESYNPEDIPTIVPVGTRLAETRRLIILGDPGSGKTTMVRWIATAYLLRLKEDQAWKDLPDVATLPDQNWLPITVRCRDLDHSCLNGSLEDVLRHILHKSEFTETEELSLRQILREKIANGHALLMLDGLDEITDLGLRARFCRQLEQISIAYPNAPIIATSRIVGYREIGFRIGRGFEHLTVADLSREDKDDFAKRWCVVIEPPERRVTATAELIHDIHSIDRIERLTSNPMLLTTMALVKRKVGKLPSRRADLFWEAVQVLLNWRADVDDPIDHHEAIPQLEYIAYAMCDRGVQQLREDEIIELLERMRVEYPYVHVAQNHRAKEFLRLLERRTGILAETGHIRHKGRPIPVFEFRHLTFQEYLAGLALVDGRFPGRDRSQKLAYHVAPLAGKTSSLKEADPRRDEVFTSENWREALRLCVAICNDDDVDSVLLAILKPRETEDSQITGRPRAILAALCLADEPNVNDDLGIEVLRALASKVDRADGNPITPSILDVAVTELAASRWGELLRSILLNEYGWVDGQDREPFPVLCAMGCAATAPEDETGLREWFVTQVARINSGDEFASVDSALGIMECAYLGKAVVVPNMIDGLISMLSGNGPAPFSAAWALGWLNQDRWETTEKGFYSSTGKGVWRPTVTEMRRIISFVHDPTLYYLAKLYLLWILKNEHTEEAVDALIMLVDNPSPWYRMHAMLALGEFKNKRARNVLVERASGENASDRRTALRALTLTSTSMDEIDYMLMSEKLNRLPPYLDPKRKISTYRIRRAAKTLNMSVQEVRERYKKIARKYSLKID